MTWMLIVMLATGQMLALGQPSEQACLADLAKVRAGIHNVVTLDNGLVLPLAKGLGCVSEAEFNLRRGGGV